jgi:hypothetical protein
MVWSQKLAATCVPCGFDNVVARHTNEPCVVLGNKPHCVGQLSLPTTHL